MDRFKLRASVITEASLAVISSIIFLFSGCQEPRSYVDGSAGYPQPRFRTGAFFGSLTGMTFLEPDGLGSHRYKFGMEEKNGMVYTCTGGFIDIAHLRDGADRTVYLAAVAYRNLMLKKPAFSFQVIEPSRYWVKVLYPKGWDQYSTQQKKKIAQEISIYLGQYFAHKSMIWHEILTWYGFSSTGLFSEKISAFSWEDTYSDVLGTRIAAQALRNNPEQYNAEMTKLIEQELNDLGSQPAKVARRATKQIEGKWFTGGFYFFVRMKKHNFDSGQIDGQITPYLVPGICQDARPKPCQAPNLQFLSRYGFKMELEIEPRVWEKSKILPAIQSANGGRINPEIDFPKILKQIENGKK